VSASAPAVPLPAIPWGASVIRGLDGGLIEAVGEHVDAFDYAGTWENRLQIADAWFLLHPLPGGDAEHVVRRLTALLEPLGDRELASVEQALCYRLSAHPAWRRAAVLYLAGAPGVRECIAEHPGIAAIRFVSDPPGVAGALDRP
jgi:hypothetical protein